MILDGAQDVSPGQNRTFIRCLILINSRDIIICIMYSDVSTWAIIHCIVFFIEQII